MSEPFLRLPHSFFSDAYWNEPREFSRAEACLDLYQLAGWGERSWSAGADVIALQRGETPPLSIRYLAKRWQWTPKKVRVFLDRLQSDTGSGLVQIRAHQETPQGHTYVLVNYELSCGQGHSEDADKGTARAQLGHKTKKVRKKEETYTSDSTGNGTVLEHSLAEGSSSPNGNERRNGTQQKEADYTPGLYTAMRSSAPQGGANGKKPQKPDDDPVFLEAWKSLPRRKGTNSKVGAFEQFQRRVKEGVNAQEMIDGAKRYAEFCDHEVKDGHENYIMAGERFFGKKRHWQNPWEY